MSILRFAGRTVALVVGLLGALAAFFVTIINFFIKNIAAGGLGNAHTPTGLLLSVLAGIGAVLALLLPRVAAVLMLVAGVGMLFVAGWLGVIPLVILAIAALLAFLDRSRPASS
jgi:hypothetical protein